MKPVITCAALAALLAPGQLLAAEPAPADTPYIMDEVVVTATRQEEKIVDVPANVTVISQEDIAISTAQSIPDLLRTEVGITVLDITGNGRNMKVDLRGFGETAQSNTLVLVDGRRVNQPDMSGTDWTLIDLERVERIEIVRGGRGAVLYGDNATGGVINIITREGGDTFHSGAKVAVGSYDYYKSSAFLSGRQENLSYNLSASHKDSDGYRDNSGMLAKDVGGNFAYDISDALQIKWSADYHKDTTDMPGSIKKSEFDTGTSRRQSLHPDNFNNLEDYYFKVNPTLFFGSDNLVTMEISHRKRSSLFFSSSQYGSYAGDTDTKTLTASPQLILHEKIGGMANTLNLGLDLTDAEEDIINTSSFAGESTYAMEKKNSGAYIHNELNLLDNLAVSAGYRNDKVKYEFDPGTPASSKQSEDLYTAGINYALEKNTAVYLNYSRSFRYPVMDEMFNFFSNTVDTGLLPQSSDNYEVGIRHRFSPMLTATTNLFRLDTKDEIFYDPTGGDYGYGANVNHDGKTRREGMELSLAADLNRLGLTVSYSYTDTSMEDGTGTDRKVPGVPTHKASAGATLALDQGFTVGVNTVYMGKRYFESDFSNSFPEQDDYVLVNAKLKYQWQNLEAYLDINNLTDKEYSEYGVLSWEPQEAYYPSPERNFLFGISMNY